MPTNQQLDALLIGALYGELSPAETLTLDAHLLAHPADAGLLAQLRQIHAVVRSGALCQSLVEPPQAVSALLLQEAARRAPKKSSVSGHAQPNWFIRLVRSMAVHPGLAAAASLALVAGVGGVLYARGQGAVQNSAPSRSITAAAERGRAAPTAPLGASAGSAAGSPVVSADSPGDLVDGIVNRDQNNQGSGRLTNDDSGALKQTGGDLSKGKLETMTATMEEDRALQMALEGRQVVAVKELEAKKRAEGVASPTAVPPTVASKPKKVAPKDYVSVSTSERQPFENDELQAVVPTNAVSGGRTADLDLSDRKDANARAGTGDDKAAKKESSEVSKVVAASKSKGASAPAVSKSADTWAAPVAEKAPVAAPGRAPRQQTAQAPLPPPGPTLPSTELAWVQGEHAKLKKLVAAGKCSEAAKVGAAMAARTPDYYQQYVATDRQVQACAAYIRERRALDSQKTSAGRPSNTATDTK